MDLQTLIKDAKERFGFEEAGALNVEALEFLPISSLPVQNFYECLDSSAPPDSLSLRDPSDLWYLASQMSYRQSLRPGLLASPAGLFHCHCWPVHENERLHLQSPAASRRFSYPPKPRAMQ